MRFSDLEKAAYIIVLEAHRGRMSLVMPVLTGAALHVAALWLTATLLLLFFAMAAAGSLRGGPIAVNSRWLDGSAPTVEDPGEIVVLEMPNRLTEWSGRFVLRLVYMFPILSGLLTAALYA